MQKNNPKLIFHLLAGKNQANHTFFPRSATHCRTKPESALPTPTPVR